MNRNVFICKKNPDYTITDCEELVDGYTVTGYDSYCFKVEVGGKEAELNIYDEEQNYICPEKHTVDFEEGRNFLGFYVKAEVTWKDADEEEQTGDKWVGFEWLDVMYEEQGSTTTTTTTDLSPFNRASISFNTINYLERTGELPEEVTDGTSLSDWGHQGNFSGDTYTLDFETVGVGNVRFILEITIILNSQHNTIIEAEYHRSEDDEDIASYYELSEFFRAHDIPLSSTSTDKIVFRVEGQEVCDSIEQYKNVQVKNENFTRIESLDHCEENSWLEIQLYQ